MTAHWCPTCGYGYGDRRWGIGDAHVCGNVTISKDRLRELEAAERLLEARDYPSTHPTTLTCE